MDFLTKLTKILVCLALLLSCSLKEAADRGFKPNTKVKPLADSESLAKRFGDGRYVTVSVKIPLTEDSVGYFDLDDVLGNEEMTHQQKGYFGKLFDSFKLAMYNIAVSFNQANRLRYSSVFEFPEIDTRFIKRARIKKVFFTTEDCRPNEQKCNDLESMGSNFNLVDTFFVNLSHPPEGRGDESLLDNVNNDDFLKIKSKTFKQDDEARLKLLNAKNKITPEDPLNIVKFENQIPFINTENISYLRRDHALFIDVNQDKTDIGDFFKTEKFEKHVKRIITRRRHKHGARGSIVTRESRGITVFLKKDGDPQKVIELINEHQTVLSKKMFIFRLDGEPIIAKRFFKRDIFKDIVLDSTLIGRSLFVELKSEKLRDEFESLIAKNKRELKRDVEIYKIDKCSNTNCLDLDGSNINLVPFLQKEPKILLETIISVRRLGETDFKYNGFVEVEVVLDLPI